MNTKKYNFSYEHRTANPGSAEATICKKLLGRLNDQTLLVERILQESRIATVEDIRNLYETPCDPYRRDDADPKEIFQWAHCWLSDEEKSRLDAADIPWIDGPSGAWIGITSFGSAWDMYVVEELADALFN